jgi:hypothetical protein
MTLDLSPEETAALVRELDNITDRDRYFVAAHSDPECDPGQASAGAGARAVAARHYEPPRASAKRRR